MGRGHRPQVAIGTGQVLLHRFYCRRSMVKFSVEVGRQFRDRRTASVDAPANRSGKVVPRGPPQPWPVSSSGSQAVAMAAIYLAAKLEECPRRARDVVNVAHYLAVTRQGLAYEPMDFYGAVWDAVPLTTLATLRSVADRC